MMPPGPQLDNGVVKLKKLLLENYLLHCTTVLKRLLHNKLALCYCLLVTLFKF